MEIDVEAAALVALLRGGRRPRANWAAIVEKAGSARPLLDEEYGLLAGQALERAGEELESWERRGLRTLTVLDADYPERLRAVESRPPLLFVSGQLMEVDARAVAVVGTRQPSKQGLEHTRQIAEHLVDDGFTVVSGLAAGIDTEAHQRTLRCGGRTIAVLGNGLDHCYPKQNAALQREIASGGAVVSQFFPESPPSRQGFPLRNAVMSGLTLATVIVEASSTSGTRIQARHALAQGRRVIVLEPLLSQPWARELAAKPGVEVVSSASRISAIVERQRSEQLLV